MILTSICLATKVQAQEYEEISYDELVQRLSKKKTKVIHDQIGSSVLDDIMIHVGVGLTNSSLHYFNGQETSTQNVHGFQLSFGIDLFSPYWASEMLVRNLGGSSDQSSSSEVQSFREFDLRVLYHEPSTTTAPGFRIGGGLGNRYLRIADGTISFEEYSPVFVLFAGLDYSLNKNFSIGAELGARAAIIPEYHDKQSLDLLIRMDTFF